MSGKGQGLSYKKLSVCTYKNRLFRSKLKMLVYLKPYVLAGFTFSYSLPAYRVKEALELFKLVEKAVIILSQHCIKIVFPFDIAFAVVVLLFVKVKNSYLRIIYYVDTVFHHTVAKLPILYFTLAEAFIYAAEFSYALHRDRKVRCLSEYHLILHLIKIIVIRLKHFKTDILYEIIAFFLVKSVFFGLCEPIAYTVSE